jgi:hypothetical protein
MQQMQEALDIASREALQARMQVAIMKRDAALAAAPSPSAMTH